MVRGGTSVVASGLAGLALVAASLLAGPPPGRLDAGTAREAIDRIVRERWEREGIRAAVPASDEELVRRIYLDLTGRIPTAEQARAYLDSRDPQKRERLVDRLLDGPEFARHQARAWTILLLGRGRLPRLADRERFEEWLEDRFAAKVGFDRIATELLTATGNPVDEGAVSYFLRFEAKPEDIAESVASRFLGIQLGCARCHDHPYERWRQEDFYGLAATFAGLGPDRPTRADRMARRRFRAMRQQGAGGSEKDLAPAERRRRRTEMVEALDALRRTYRLVDRGPARLETEIGGERRVVTARFLDGTVPTGSARRGLAAWLTAPENPYFARAVANRVWESLFGRGLVDPVDAFGEGNPPSHPELLDALARRFVASGYDLRDLYRLVLTSDTYALSSRYEGALPPADRFAVARLRRMTPEQLFDSLVLALGLEPPQRGPEAARFEERRARFFRRWVHLFDTDAVDDEELAQGTIPQALELLNGRLTNAGAGVRRRGAPPDVDTLFLGVLSRRPTAEERAAVDALLAAAPRRREALEDVRWALVNTTEFILVH